MARGSNRDVTLTLSLETLGEEGVKALGQSIQQLAAQGGKAGPEFAQLADEIDRIATQQQALEAFKALGNETEQLETRQRSVAQAVDSTSTRLQELGTVTQQAAARQREAATALTDAQKSYNDITAELRNYKAGTADALKGTDAYVTGLKVLVTQQAAAKNAIIDARTEQRAANKDLSEAESAQTKIVASLAKQEKALQSANNALAENRTEIGRAVKASEELGVSTTDVAAAEAKLLAAFNAVGGAAAARKASIDEMIEADKLLAIETASLAELQRRGADALQAEVLAQRDAAKAVREYEAAVSQAADNAAQWQREAEAVVNAAEAAQRLQRETVTLVAAQQELQQQRAFEKQAEEAKRLIQAADYVRFWTDALDKADTQAAQTAAGAEEAAQRIDTAFKTLGVRSVQDLQREIAEVRVAMATAADQAQRTGTSIDGAFSTGQAKIRELERQIREVSGTLTTADRAADLFKNSIGQIAAGNLIADAIGSLVEKVKELGREFITTIVQTEQLRRGLNAVYGSVITTAQQIDFLRSTALSAGVSVGSLQSNFVKFAASMQSANIPLAVSNDLFGSVTRAAGTLGIAGEEVTGMLQALAQIASKGTVSMEELRQQLGDRLPGAIGLSAKGLGITEQQLIKLVETGNLAARDFFPALSGALKTLNGEVTGLRPGFENLKTTLTTLAQESGDALWTQLLAGGLKLLTATVGILGGALLGASNALSLLGSAAIATLGAIGSLGEVLRGETTVTEAYARATGFLKEELDKAAQRQSKFSDAVDQALDGTQANIKATEAQALSYEKNASAAAALGTQVITTTEGIKALGLASSVSGQLAAGQAESYVKLSVAIAETLKDLDKRQEAADKEAKAIDITGASLVKMTELRGDESEALRVQAEAAENNTKALQKADALRQAEVEVLLVQKQALEQLAVAQDGNLEKRKVELDAINQKLIKAGAEAEQSKAAVEQAKAEAFNRGLVAKAYEDNAVRVEEFAKAVVAAQGALNSSSRAFAEGRASADDLTAANRRLTEAEYLLRDAINDKVKAIKVSSDVQQASINVALAGFNVRKAEIDQLIATARQYGFEAEAVYYEIEAKRLQIKITELTTQAKKLEAQATIDATEAERQQLIATGNLTPVKEKEIQARLLNAKAKAIEAQAGEQIIKGLSREIELMEIKLSRTPVAISGINAETTARLKNAEAIDRQTASTKNLAAAESSNRVNTPESFTNTPFRSGSSAGANPADVRTVSAGQAVNKPTDGEWVYTTNPYEVQVKGVDARGNPLAGGWMRVQRNVAGVSGGFSGLGVGTGLTRPSPAPAGGGASEDSQSEVNIRLAQTEALRRGDQAEANRLAMAASEAAKARVGAASGNSAPTAPTTTGVSINVTIGGKQYGIGATNQAQADAIIASLEAAYAAGGG
jgi:tape measure domain-containing protein